MSIRFRIIFGLTLLAFLGCGKLNRTNTTTEFALDSTQHRDPISVFGMADLPIPQTDSSKREDRKEEKDRKKDETKVVKVAFYIPAHGFKKRDGRYKRVQREQFGELLLEESGDRFVYRFWEWGIHELSETKKRIGDPIKGVRNHLLGIAGFDGKQYWTATFRRKKGTNQYLGRKTFHAGLVLLFDSLEDAADSDSVPFPRNNPFYDHAPLHDLQRRLKAKNFSKEALLSAATKHIRGSVVEKSKFSRQKFFVPEKGKQFSYVTYHPTFNARSWEGARNYDFQVDEHPQMAIAKMFVSNAYHMKYSPDNGVRRYEIERAVDVRKIPTDQFSFKFYSDDQTETQNYKTIKKR